MRLGDVYALNIVDVAAGQIGEKRFKFRMTGVKKSEN